MGDLSFTPVPLLGDVRLVQFSDGEFIGRTASSTHIKQMNYFSPIAPVLTATLLFAPMADTPAKAATQAEPADKWEFITDAEDGTLYFGGKVTTVGKTAVLELKSVNDPDQPVGVEDDFRMVFNCSNKTFKSSTGWERVDFEKVGGLWFSHACGVGGQ